MTTPADFLRDTDAPLVASVSSIPYTGTTTAGQRSDFAALYDGDGDGEGGWNASDIGSSGSQRIPDRSSSRDSNSNISGDGIDGDASSHSLLNEEEIARRKRIYLRERLNLLDRLFRDVDMLIYLELGALYYMDCSLLRFLIRVIIQLIFFTPKSGSLPASVPRHPFVGAVFASNLWLIFRHIRSPHAIPLPDSRGYLQGGIFIDFVGVKAPVSRLALVAIDLLVALCQIILVGIILEKVKIGKNLAKKGRRGELETEVVIEGDTLFEIRQRRQTARAGEEEEDEEEDVVHHIAADARGSEQTHDNEERGVLAARPVPSGSTGRRIRGGDLGPISLRDMLASEPTPEEQAIVENERSPLILPPAAPSPNHGGYAARHERNMMRYPSHNPSSSSTTAPTTISSPSAATATAAAETSSSNSPPPPYANSSLHPLDPLTCATASIMDYFVLPTLRRQWRYSARSSLFIAPEVGVPRRSPSDTRSAGPALPGMGIGRWSAWAGLNSRIPGRRVIAGALGRTPGG